MADVKAETNGHGDLATLDLTKVRIDLDKLKLRELTEIERLLGRHVGADIATGVMGMDFLQACLWLELRKQQPSLTFEAVGEFESADLYRVEHGPVEDGEVAVDPPSPPNASSSDDASPAAASSKASLRSAGSTA